METKWKPCGNHIFYATNCVRQNGRKMETMCFHAHVRFDRCGNRMETIMETVFFAHRNPKYPLTFLKLKLKSGKVIGTLIPSRPRRCTL